MIGWYRTITALQAPKRALAVGNLMVLTLWFIFLFRDFMQHSFFWAAIDIMMIEYVIRNLDKLTKK